MQKTNLNAQAAKLFPHHYQQITGEFSVETDSLESIIGENFQFIVDAEDEGLEWNIGIAIGNRWVRHCFADNEDFIVGLPFELATPLQRILASAKLEDFESVYAMLDELIHQANVLDFAHTCYSDSKICFYSQREVFNHAK